MKFTGQVSIFLKEDVSDFQRLASKTKILASII